MGAREEQVLTVVHIIHAQVRILWVIYDHRTTQPFTILKAKMRVIPKHSTLIGYPEIDK